MKKLFYIAACLLLSAGAARAQMTTTNLGLPDAAALKQRTDEAANALNTRRAETRASEQSVRDTQKEIDKHEEAISDLKRQLAAQKADLKTRKQAEDLAGDALKANKRMLKDQKAIEKASR